MTYNGNANVIILGHRSVFEEIRSHVADLVAMNQVRRSFWIDTAIGLSDAAVRVLEYYKLCFRVVIDETIKVLAGQSRSSAGGFLE